MCSGLAMSNEEEIIIVSSAEYMEYKVFWLVWSDPPPLAISYSSCEIRSLSCLTSASSCMMYVALRSLDSLAVIRFLSRRISLDIPEGLFLGSELLLHAKLELAQDALEVAVVLEVASALITLGLSDDFKWILNTIGERAVIERRRAAWWEWVVGVGSKGGFDLLNHKSCS